MRAATNTSAGDTIRTLLDAGADPSLKDDSGQTALDMTRTARKYDSAFYAAISPFAGERELVTARAYEELFPDAD